jgi:hypothetical protein
MDANPRALFALAACSIAALLVAIGWKAGAWFRPHTEPVLAVSAPSAFISEPDVDGNGVPDWQDALMGLTPTATTTALYAATTAVAGTEKIPTATGAVTERLVQQYLYLKDTNAYTDERGERLGRSLAENVYVRTPFTPYTMDSVKTGALTRTEYRNVMRTALSPLLTLSEPDFVTYARFIDTKDQSLLKVLQGRAQIYKEVGAELTRLRVPAEALSSHVDTANAISYYGTVLDAMVVHQDDPIASMALLREYNEAEQYLGTALSLVSRYYSVDTP